MAYNPNHALAALALEDRVDVQDQIIDRIEELEERRDSEEQEEPLDAGEEKELQALRELLNELEGGDDVQFDGLWYPAYLIHEHDFENYAEELAEECGMINPDAKWPLNCIDWTQAAKELQADYTGAEIAGFTFFWR